MVHGWCAYLKLVSHQIVPSNRYYGMITLDANDEFFIRENFSGSDQPNKVQTDILPHCVRF